MQIGEFGGSKGIRDLGLLESALARPINLYLYEDDVSLSRLAASYCFGISRDHPFVDGNKRVAYVVARTFLKLNNHDLGGTYNTKLDTMMALASGTLDEDQLAIWFQEHTAPIS
jgi:death-on-curing protein